MTDGVRRAARGIAAVALMGVLSLGAAACGSSDDSSDTGSTPASTGSATTSGEAAQLRIGYNPNPTNTTIIVADKQGFFKKNGLDVKLTPLEAAAAQMPALGKQFDLLTTTSYDVVRGKAQNLNPVVVQGETMEKPGLESSVLVVPKDITSVEQLKGKKIAVPSLAGGLYGSVVMQLAKAGIGPNDVKFIQVPFPNMLDQLKAGRVDAAVTIVPFDGQMLAEGFTKLPDPILAVTGNKETMTAGWAADADWAADNQATIDKFKKAQEEALAWMKAHPDEAKQLLVTEFHLPQVAADHYPLLDYIDYEVTPEEFQGWIDSMEETGQIKEGSVPDASALVQ
jgi:NitT/TauT family transport system substrate-binding protein